LIKKPNKASNSVESKYLNNKRKHEISLIYKSIFSFAKHYKCGYFVMEELNFKEKNLKEENKEFNRKTKNIWNRTFQSNLISKYCNQTGIQLIEVNPVYSSFIGNLTYNYFDPINASIEIGRRGMFKYIKGKSLYPKMTSTIIDTMMERFGPFGDVQFIKDCISWIDLFKRIKETGFIYRWQLEDLTSYNCFSKDHIKSKVNLFTF